MMWTGALLASYAIALGTGGAFALRRAAWADRAPRLGLLAWQVLSLSVLLAIALSGLVMISPGLGAQDDLSMLVSSFTMLGQGHFSHAASALWCLAFIGVATATIGTVAIAALRAFFRSRRDRSAHLAQLAVVGSHDALTGATVVDHPIAAAYCLPGRNPAVVMTTAAMDVLDAAELSAVLEHERAHLRGRHDLILAASGALRRSLGFIPLFRWGHPEQARLLELIADDAAAGTASRRTVATAMLHMAESAVRLPALGAGGSHAAERVERMLRPSRPLSRVQACVAAVLLAVIAIVPVGLALAPAATAAGLEACGPAGPSMS